MAHYIEVEESLLIGPSLNTSFSPQPQAAETAAKPSSWWRRGGFLTGKVPFCSQTTKQRPFACPHFGYETRARTLLEDDKIREEGPQPQRPVVEAARAVLERKRPSSRRRSRVQHSTAHSMWLTSAAAVTITTSTTAASASHYTYHFAASIIWPPLHDSIDSKIELIR